MDEIEGIKIHYAKQNTPPKNETVHFELTAKDLISKI